MIEGANEGGQRSRANTKANLARRVSHASLHAKRGLPSSFLPSVPLTTLSHVFTPSISASPLLLLHDDDAEAATADDDGGGGDDLMTQCDFNLMHRLRRKGREKERENAAAR